MVDEVTEKPIAGKSKLSRRDFLKVAGVGTGAFIISNSLIGEYLSKLDPQIEKLENSLSEYKIAWKARPWVWINLAIASEKTDGIPILPGQEISINKLFGFDEMDEVSRQNTDPSKGFIAAQLSDPSKLDGWGYGLCLGSTAIFRASLRSPLLITERGTHYDIYNNYFKDMPIGTDAAVFKPDPGDTLPETDLKLKNPTNTELILHFRIYDEFGKKLEPPKDNVSQMWYKASYLDQVIKVLRNKIESTANISLPDQYIPEYSFGNKKIIVQNGISGKNIPYSAKFSTVKHDDSTIVNGISQYAFTRDLTIYDNQNISNFNEKYISQYK